MATILIVDDDRNIRRVLTGLLQEAGHSTLEAPDVDGALTVIREGSIDAIISDLKMPGKSGLDLLAANRSLKPSVPLIMITAHGDIETAVAAMKKGAYDFITKPFDEEELLRSVRKALAESEKNRELLSEYFETEDSQLPDIIGGAPVMQGVFSIVEKAAPTDSTVLISGETGVGKELVARAIHRRSRRRGHPLVKVNCAALSESLLESELFGHEKGAFTGAVTRKPGRKTGTLRNRGRWDALSRRDRRAAHSSAGEAPRRVAGPGGGACGRGEGHRGGHQSTCRHQPGSP
jgi:two-component system NtrC family response regulator